MPCVWTYNMCFTLQKVCFCWRLINPRACWCLESSHPQGKSDSKEANCNIPAGLSGYVNPLLCISGRACACERAYYIETSCVMLQNSLFGWWTITYRVLVASHMACVLMASSSAPFFWPTTRDPFRIYIDAQYVSREMYFWTYFTSTSTATQPDLWFVKIIVLLKK